MKCDGNKTVQFSLTTLFGFTLAMACAATTFAQLGIWSAMAAGDSKPSEFGRSGNQGEGFGNEQSIQGKGQIPPSTLGQDTQVTLGGARPLLEGEVLKVQGENYLIRDSAGSEVLVRVNKDTNMDCAVGHGQQTSMMTGRQADEQREIPPTAHMKERSVQQSSMTGQQQAQDQEQKGEQILKEQQQRQSHGDNQRSDSRLDQNAAMGEGVLGPHGQSGSNTQAQSRDTDKKQQAKGNSHQAHSSAGAGDRIGDQSGTQTPSALGKDSGGDIAQGSGFSIGSKGGCAFKAGDRVRAQVSDLGTVLYIKGITDEDIKLRQTRSGQTIYRDGSLTPGQKAAAQQQAQSMQPGSVPAPADLQNPDVITGTRQTTKAQPQEKENLCEGCKLLRGLVLTSDNDSILMKDTAVNKEVRFKVDSHTRLGNLSHPRTGTLVEGDRIEAFVKPDGVAWSITGLKQQQGQPGVVGAPGD